MSKVLFVAGPNGSGKSTITSGINIIGDYVNADEIQKELKCSSMEAAIIAEKTRRYFVDNNLDFTFETVLSTTRNIELLNKAKDKGYYVIGIYVVTLNPNINLSRVKCRVSQGGHDVPKEKVVDRYFRAMRLIPQLFQICDELYFFDNSVEREEAEDILILESINGVIQAYPNRIWTKEMLYSLLSGSYPEEFLNDKSK